MGSNCFVCFGAVTLVTVKSEENFEFSPPITIRSRNQANSLQIGLIIFYISAISLKETTPKCFAFCF